MSSTTETAPSMTEEPYFVPALKLLGELVVLGLGATIVNIFLVSRGAGAIVFVLLVNLAVSIIAVLLLFRKVDTLVLKRLVEHERQIHE